MTKILSLFNHKGGVSKTTTVFHLGWKMASLGKRVLIVDADPQCNLTGLALGLEDYDSLFKFYDSKQNTDIFNSLAPIFAIESPTASAPHGKTSITETKNKNLFVLAGNIRFSEIDAQIATAFTSSERLPILRTFIGAIGNLINRISHEHDIDIVLIDMSPSVSSTNQCILMSSDYFIIPLSPDFYCYQAIDSLSNVLPKWSNEISKFRGKGEYALPESPPKMLGFIAQNYRIYTTIESEEVKEQKRMAKAYTEWLDKIKEVIKYTLVPSLKKAHMIIDEEVFKGAVTYDNPYNLAGVQNFSGLIPVSQKLSKPIYELTESDGNWTGARWLRKDDKGKEHGIKINIKEADNVYNNLANAVIKMLDESN